MIPDPDGPFGPATTAARERDSVVLSYRALFAHIDWSLVPDVEFRHRFTADDFERQLRRALHEDALQDRRAEMRGRIFESDPLAASGGLLNLVDRLVARTQQDDFTVDFCGASVPQAAPIGAVVERLGAACPAHAD